MFDDYHLDITSYIFLSTPKSGFPQFIYFPPVSSKLFFFQLPQSVPQHEGNSEETTLANPAVIILKHPNYYKL